MHIKDIALAPIYLYQAHKIKRDGLSLPEAQGERHGTIDLSTPSLQKQVSDHQALNILMVGDSSAAGVGVNHQEDALLGHLLNKLKKLEVINQQFSQIDWALHATTGHTSFDILRRLFVLPKPATPVDIMLILVGVNDTTGGVKLEDWRKQLQEIINLSKRKFAARHIIFPYLPPMEHMPAIPRPLSTFIGAKSDVMNEQLQQVSNSFEGVSTLQVDFSQLSMTALELFSEDGFHPNTKAYEFWADELTKHINELLSTYTFFEK